MQTYYEILSKKYQEDTGQAPPDPNNPAWLAEYQAQQARKAPPAPALETAPDGTISQNQTLKVVLKPDDPLSPVNYFAPETLRQFNLDERQTRYDKWMRDHADTYLTPIGKTQYQRERRREAPDNLFGIVKSDGVVGVAQNAGLSLGQGVVGSFEAIASLFGADNEVASALRNVGDKLGAMKTEDSRISAQAVAQRIKEAKASGSTSEEIAAYLNAIAESPVEMLAQGIGSFATLGFGKAAQLAKLATAGKAAGAAAQAAKVGLATNVAVGAAQNVGDLKASQYEQVRKQAEEYGISPELANQIAVKAQEYSWDKAGQTTIAAILGAVGGGMGVEPAFLRFGAKLGATVPVGAAARTVSAVKAGVAEAVTEGAQSAYGQLGANQASIKAGAMDKSQLMEGVVGAGVQGAVLGAMLAGPIDVLSTRPDTPKAGPPPVPGTAPAQAAQQSLREQIIAQNATAHAMPDGDLKDTATDDAIIRAEAANDAAVKAGQPPVFTDDELADLADGVFKRFTVANPANVEPPTIQPIGAQNAVQEQSTNSSVLRSQESQVGLQEVGGGNQGDQGLAQTRQTQSQGQGQEVTSALPPAPPPTPNKIQEMVGRSVVYQGVQGSLVSTPYGFGVLADGDVIPVESGASGASPTDLGLSLYQGDGSPPAASLSAPPEDAGTQPPAPALRRPQGQAEGEQVVAQAAARRERLIVGRARRKAERADRRLDRKTTPETATAAQPTAKQPLEVPAESSTDNRAALKSETQRDAFDFYTESLVDAVAGPNPTPEQLDQAVEQVQYLLALIEGKLLNQMRNKGKPNRTPFLFEDKPVSLSAFFKLLVESAEAADAYRKAVSSLERLPSETDPQVMGQSDLTITQAHNMAMADALMEDLRQEYGDAVAENILAKVEQTWIDSDKPITPTTLRATLEAELAKVDAAVEAGNQAELDNLIVGLESAYGPEKAATIVQSAVTKQGEATDVASLLPLIREEIRNAEQTRKTASRKKRPPKAVVGAGNTATKADGTSSSAVADGTGKEAPANLRVAARKSETKETLLDQTTLQTALDKGLSAGLDDLAKKTKNQRVATIASKLSEVLDGITVTSGYVYTGNAYQNPRAAWYPQNLEVRLSSEFDGQWTDVDLLHEATHAAVDRLMHVPDGELTKLQRSSKEGLSNLFQLVATSPYTKAEYGATSIHEFLAEMFGNQDFQLKVAQYIPVPKGNAFFRFVQLAANMVGIKWGTALSTSRVDGLIADLFMAPEVRVPQAESLRLNPTPRPEQERLTTMQDMGLAIGETFVDYGIRGLDEIQSEEESARATNPTLAQADQSVRKEFTLRDVAGLFSELSKTTVNVVDAKIRELSKSTGLDADDLRYQASRYQIAKHALHQNARKDTELEDSVNTAQYMLDLHESAQTILGSYQKEVNSLTAKIDRFFERGLGQSPDMVSRTRLNKMFGEMTDLVEKVSLDLDKIGLQATPTGRTATLLKQAMVQHSYEARTAGDVRRAIQAAKRFRDDLAMMLGPREAITKVLASAETELMAFRLAHATDRVVGPDGELVTAVPLMGGLRNIEAQKIIADTQADHNASSYLELAEDYKQAFITLTNQAVAGGVITQAAATDFFARYPEYVSLMGRSSADDDTVILETNAKGFLSSAEGSVHMLHSNDTFTNLVARTNKLASEIANQRVGEAVHQAAEAGSKLFHRTVPSGGGTPYIKARVNGQSLFYAPTTEAGKRMFGLHPGQGLVDNRGMQVLTKTTTLLGRSTTQAVALFAPVNALFRDIPTRMFNLVGRKDDLQRPDGSRVGVYATRARMLINAVTFPTIAEALNYAWTKKEGHYMRRFVATGGHMTFSKMLKTEAEVSRTFAKGPLAKIQNGVAAASELLHKWNTMFETIAVLSSFKAMVDGGMSDRDAGYLTLDMMNFRKSGAFTGAYMRPFFMFVNPAAQDALQFKRSVYKRGKFNLQAMAEIGAMATAAAAIFAMAREGDDEDDLGGKRMDSLSTRELYNNVVIPYNGQYTKIPLGFGWIQTAWQIGVARARYEKGLINSADWAADVTSAVTKNFLITGAPEVAFTKDPGLFFTQMFTPDLANPIVQVVTNKNWAGQPITSLIANDKFASEQGRWKTPEAYKTAAIRIRETTGVDVAPESVKTLAEGYLIGPMALGLDAFVKAEDDKKAKGIYSDSSIPAWHRALGANKFYAATDEARTVDAQYYTEFKRVNDLIKSANSVAPKTAAREKSGAKAARLASSGELTLEQAEIQLETERKLTKLAQESREAYQKHRAGEDMMDVFTDIAGRELEAKRAYVLEIRETK